MKTYEVLIFCGGSEEPFKFNLDRDAIRELLSSARCRLFRVDATIFNGDRVDAIKIDQAYWEDKQNVDR